MQFARRHRPEIAAGRITCTVRVWHSPRVKVGNRYRMDDGHVRVTSLRAITETDVTDDLARVCGFEDRTMLLTAARHGSGDNIYRIEFVYEPPSG